MDRLLLYHRPYHFMQDYAKCAAISPGYLSEYEVSV